MNIFLSYNWENKDIADQIDEWFSENNIKLKRDVRDLKYKQSIKEFMKSIRNADFVIMIISEDYLKSKNCMYEVLEFVKEQKFKDKIIPVIKSSEIFNIKYQVTIQKFWTEKISELREIQKELDSEKSIPLLEEINIFNKVENELLDFLKVVCDMNNIVLKDDQFIDSNFDTIIKYIGKDNLNQNDIIFTCRLVKEKYKPAKVIEYLNNLFGNISVIRLGEISLSVRFKSYLSSNELEKKTYQSIGKDNIDSLDVFDYKDAYYFVAKRKIDEYSSKHIVWWSPLSGGYTKNLKDAGLYSEKEIKRFIPKWFYEHQLAIKASYVDSLNSTIFEINSRESAQLIEDRKVIIGDVKYEEKDYF
ncbi:toll/interleukin-1 receptor domain-containing protein [Aquimarina sp. 433]